MLTAEVQRFEQLSDTEREAHGDKHAHYLRVTHNGASIFLVSDSIAPEDARFTRDLAFVRQAIQQAYELGVTDGRIAELEAGLKRLSSGEGGSNRMAENSKIEWTDHTFNPWVGCTKVSPACDHCYAESWAKRTGHPELWAGTRRRTSAQNWRGPVKWNRDAGERGVRYRVFCASLADVFDNAVPDEWRADLWKLIAATPNLDWLLLTKRIGNAARMGVEGFDNVWLGATVVNQEEANRDIPKLMAVQVRVRFLSMEPLLGPVDFRQVPGFNKVGSAGSDALRGFWVIMGGESGHGARPMDPEWCWNIAAQCRIANVPFFMKQGSAANWPFYKDVMSFPMGLRVREFPRV